jgi:hypothetical protein
MVGQFCPRVKRGPWQPQPPPPFPSL